MQKVRIRIEINDHIIEGTGTINNNVVNINADEETISFDLSKNILIKENKDLIVKLDFLNRQVFYELIEEKTKFSNKIAIISLTNNHKQVIINYQIEQADFLLKINYETI